VHFIWKYFRRHAQKTGINRSIEETNDACAKRVDKNTFREPDKEMKNEGKNENFEKMMLKNLLRKIVISMR